MKNYLGEMVDVTGDGYLNPTPAYYDNGVHNRNVSVITSISIHHDASVRPHDYDSMARYYQEAKEHYARLGPGLQYHYKIDNTGVIFKVRPHEVWTYTVGSTENVTCISICLDGNFEFQEPTREQFEALYQLIENLCEQHPEFPATWPNVRSHNDYSATACCGANLRNRILAINSKEDAQAQLLNVGNYDWPELQPQPAPNPTPAPPPAPVDIILEDVMPAVYVAQVATHLDDIKTGQHIKEFDPGTKFDIRKRAKYNGNSWLLTAYSVEKNIMNGIPEKDLIIKNDGNEPLPPSEPTPPPVPLDPAEPGNDTDDVEQRLSFLERVVKYIVDFFSGLFKGFNPPKE